MRKPEDQIVKPDEAKPDAKIEKEKAEIFKFSEEVRDEYVGKSKGTKAEKKLATLEKREAIINERIVKAKEAGEEVDMKKIIADSLKGAPKLMRAMESIWQRGEEKKAKQIVATEVEVVETEKEKETGQKEQKVVEIKKEAEQKELKEPDNVVSEVNELIENIRIKLGAAQASGLISEEKLEKFEEIFNGKLDELNGILKGDSSADDSEAKLNEFYKDLLRLKGTFFDFKEKPQGGGKKKGDKKTRRETQSRRNGRS